MRPRITIRSIMLVVAIVALVLGASEAIRLRDARIAAARASRQRAHEAKYVALAGRHAADWGVWQRRFAAFGEADRRAFMAMEHWKKSAMIRDAGEIAGRRPVDSEEWPHPDPEDSFPILQGPSEAWVARLEAHKALTRQCWARLLYHQRQQGICFSVAHSPVDAGVFADQLAEPAPVVDPYPPEFRGELQGGPPRKPAVEPIPESQIGL